MWAFIALVGTMVAVLIIAWWIRRSQRGVDDYIEREYRDPPVFLWPEGPL